MKKTIICIGREYGSGGHAIGEIIAGRTGYTLYDKDSFIRMAKERGYDGEVQEYLEEEPVNSLLYSIAVNYTNPKRQKKFPLELVREIAEEKPCVIIGRCAGYLTRDLESSFSVFVHADLEKRIQCVMERDHISTRHKAKRLILNMDGKRSTFRKYYTQEVWGMAKYYDMSVNTTGLTYEQAADLILTYKQLCEEA